MNKKIYITNNLKSQIIDFLRFPLIVGVVFIHGALTTPNTELGNDVYIFPIFYYCSQFMSNILGRLAVPLFFLISGFLFFLTFLILLFRITKTS